MIAGRTSDEGAGGPVRHVPVLLPEVLDHLAVKEGGRYIDGTFGAGGYSRAILERGGTVLAFDRDPTAIEAGAALVAQSNGRLTLVEGSFGDLDAHARAQNFAPVDGVVLDVGISSMQIDEAERGFSFRLDGPLDMRMGRSGLDAATLRTELQTKSLATIASEHGKSVDELKAFLTTQFTESLAQAVADGRITQAEADEKSAGFAQRLDEEINEIHAKGARGPRGGMPGMPPEATPSVTQ